MDSKDVNRKIREVIKPYLRDQGFTVFSQRNFWRFQGEDIHVINFQSFNSYLAEGLGITTYSYAVNLGLYTKRINLGYPIKQKDGLLLPAEYQCHFRGSIKSGIEQNINRDDLWAVNSSGSNLEICMADTLEQIRKYQKDWFDELAEISRKVDVVENERQDMKILWGWGNNPSPMRSLYLACLYYEIDRAKSLRYIDEVANGSSFRSLFTTRGEGIEYIEKIHLTLFPT
jgi:hypothetical protein